MLRFSGIALGILLSLTAAAQQAVKTKGAVLGRDSNTELRLAKEPDGHFPSVSKDQTRAPHHAKVLACDTSCGGPNLVCHYGECNNSTKALYCSLPTPFDGYCTCQGCTP